MLVPFYSKQDIPRLVPVVSSSTSHPIYHDNKSTPPLTFQHFNILMVWTLTFKNAKKLIDRLMFIILIITKVFDSFFNCLVFSFVIFRKKFESFSVFIFVEILVFI